LVPGMHRPRSGWPVTAATISKRFEQDGPMTNPVAAMRSLVVEREMPHTPEKVWRALTQGPLIAGLG
jgi:hypothetical protein